MSRARLALVLGLSFQAGAWAAGQMFHCPEQLEPLGLDPAGAKGWRVVVRSVQPPCALLYPADSPSIELALRNDSDAPLEAEPIGEVVRIGTRLARWDQGAEVAAVAPLSKPVRVKLPGVRVGPKEEKALDWRPGRADDFRELGAYAVIVELPGKGRQAAATFVRIPPRTTAAGKGSPLIFTLAPKLDLETQLDLAERLGYRWVNAGDVPNWATVSPTEPSTSLGPGPAAPFDWARTDAWFAEFRKRGLHVITTMCGSPRHTIPDAAWRAGSRVHAPGHDARFGDFVEELVARYCGADGQGPLQVIDLSARPCESGGGPGWPSDPARYRALYQIVWERARKVTGRLIVAAPGPAHASDTFLSLGDGERLWGSKLRMLTSRREAPHECFGPRLAQKLLATAMDTGAWAAGSAESLVAVASHGLAAGHRKLAVGRAEEFLWENGPGGPLATPTAAAAAFFLHFVAGMDFERIVLHDRLPWLYQWGGGERLAFLLAGDRARLYPEAATIYGQIRANGTVTLDAMGGRLRAWDLFGGPYTAEAGQYRLPCSLETVYLEAPGLPAEMVTAVLANGRIEGVRPVEFFADDFTVPIQRLKSLEFDVHNVLPHQVQGALTILPPSSISLQETVIALTLGAGATRTISLPINWVKPHPANAYPFTFRFEGAGSKAEWTEELHANTIAYGSPSIDGNLADWAGAVPVTLRSPEVDYNLAEAAWRPWETRRDVARGMAEARFQWDERCLYLAVRERNHDWRPKPRLSTRKDDAYFGAGDLAHVCTKDPTDALPFTRDCLQLALRFAERRTRLPAHGVVPPRMIAADDTDYEYALWGTTDGGTEVWRSAAPDLGFFHFLPRCIPEGYDGVPKGAQAVVRRFGDDTIYEAAIPWADMAGLRPEPGKVINLALALPGTGLELGAGRSRPRSNALTLRPTWAGRLSNDIRWGFIKD